MIRLAAGESKRAPTETSGRLIPSGGYHFVVDMDLDTMNHSKLIQILSETINDGRAISLIHHYLNVGVMVSGLFEESHEEVPRSNNGRVLLEKDWNGCNWQEQIHVTFTSSSQRKDSKKRFFASMC